MDPLKVFLAGIEDPTRGCGATATRQRVLHPGRVFAEHYRLRQRIAHSGMASVWEADDIDLGRLVAIKFLAESLLPDVVNRKRFDQEAKAAARLRTPFALQIYAHGIAEGVPFIVMERLYGEDLQERLERVGRLPLPLVGKIASETGRALREVHSMGIIHRDLKPRNLFLARYDGAETVKLLDFGVAKDTLNEDLVTRIGVMLGSPAYMSPEQISGDHAIDARSDLWSLGVIVYRALTGEKPFDGDIAAVMQKITRGRPRKPSSVCPELPPSVDDFLAKALAPKREERFRDASEFIASFDTVVRDALGDCPTIMTSSKSDTDKTPVVIEPSQSEEPTWPAPVAQPRSRGSGLRLGGAPTIARGPVAPGAFDRSPRSFSLGDAWYDAFDAGSPEEAVPADETPVAQPLDVVEKNPRWARQGRAWFGALVTFLLTGALAAAIVWYMR